MLGYERMMSRHHRYDEYDDAGDGLISVTAYMTVSTTWATMTFYHPYMTALSFKDEVTAKLWYKSLSKHLDDCNRIEASVIVASRVQGRDHDRVMHIVRRELGLDQHERPPDLEAIIDEEASLRCRCAQGIIQLKHLIPALPTSQAQPMRLRYAKYGNIILHVNDDVPISTTLDNSKQDLDRFTSSISAVRWDKLDDVLQTCHQRPTVVMSDMTRPEGTR